MCITYLLVYNIGCHAHTYIHIYIHTHTHRHSPNMCPREENAEEEHATILWTLARDDAQESWDMESYETKSKQGDMLQHSTVLPLHHHDDTINTVQYWVRDLAKVNGPGNV